MYIYQYFLFVLIPSVSEFYFLKNKFYILKIHVNQFLRTTYTENFTYPHFLDRYFVSNFLNVKIFKKAESDCVSNLSALSNPDDAQNVSCLELSQKSTFHMGWVISILSCQYVYSKLSRRSWLRPVVFWKIFYQKNKKDEKIFSLPRKPTLDYKHSSYLVLSLLIRLVTPKRL